MIVGFAEYTDEIIDGIINHELINAVVMGDPFCNKKMYEYGRNTMLEMIRALLDQHKDVIYQTPRYITERNFDEEMQLVEYLVHKLGVRRILVQDIGVVDYVHSKMPEAELIWSMWGRSRMNMINAGFVSTLRNLGVQYIENDIMQRNAAFESLGVIPYYVARGVHYTTLNRECYSKYLEGNFSCECYHECKAEQILKYKNDWTMTVDGYVLNRIYRKKEVPEYSDRTVVYVKDMQEFKTFLKEI